MHDMHIQPRPLGGRILTVPVAILSALVLVGLYYIARRYWFGIGAVANVNPGYPWGIWVAFDVIVGPAIGCGGFAMALLTYALNKGEYHPLMRPALIGGLFGYTLAGVAVMIDLGRYVNSLNLLLPWHLNTNSIMLETALCVMAYVTVLWIEFSPAFLEKFGLDGLRRFLEKYMFVIIALGMLLPTMHQSALGTILTVNESKLSPLWWTQFLPLLYLISAVMMGYAVVAFEATLVSRGFRLASEAPLLASIGKVTLWLTVAFLGIRFAVIIVNGNFGLAFVPGREAFLFWTENLLFAAAALLLATDAGRRSERSIFLAACALILGGAMYRLSSYLFVYQGTRGWQYFPSVPELMITIGLVALHVLLFILFCKLLPVLTAPRQPSAEGRAT